MNINLGEVVADFFRKKKEIPVIQEIPVVKYENTCIHEWRLTDLVPMPNEKGYKLVCSKCDEHKILSKSVFDEFTEAFPAILKDCRLTGHDFAPTSEEVETRNWFNTIEIVRYSNCRNCGKTVQM